MTKIEVENLKMLRETLCVAQGTVWRAGDSRSGEHAARIQKLIDQIDVLRPLGSNGKHGNLHTEECGCEDKPATGVTGRFNATKNVLAERERELLNLKGPCSNKACVLHYAHYGPCNENMKRSST